MSGSEIMTWLLKCGDLTTVSKLQAIKKNIATGNPIYFSTPESYDNFDFSIEPSESYQQLCKEEAQRIRDSYKKVIVWYSGGCDSHFVLNTFLQNKIKVDEINIVKSGWKQADYEIDKYALPFAKTLDIKINLLEPNIEYYQDYYYLDKACLGTTNEYHNHFRLNNHFENLQHFDQKDTAHVFGKEKPALCYTEDQWYTYFLDISVNHQPGQINFYIDNPKIHAKQCHMLRQAIIENKPKSQWNNVTYYNEHQDFWNKGLGRYTEGDYPMKALFVDGYHNDKDRLALQYAPQKMIDSWKSKNKKLTDELGTQWFNQGDPALGTVGVFSKFMCLTKKDTKSVDDLFPHGFLSK